MSESGADTTRGTDHPEHGTAPEGGTGPGCMADRVIAVVLLAVALTLFVTTLGFPPPGQSFDPGTAALPRLVAVVLAALSVALLLAPERRAVLPHRQGLVPLGGILALTLLYALLLEPLGFPLITTAFVVAALLLIGVRRPLPIALTSVGLAAGLYLVFSVLLDVYLPLGPLEGIGVGLGLAA